MSARSFALFVAIFACAAVVRAEPISPKVIVSHYGRLLKDDDTPADGSHSFRVRLYTERVPGASSDQQIWEDVFASVPVTRGLFSLPLGSGAALDASKFAGRAALYMSVSIDGGVELSPRLPVGRVPMAAQAENAVHADSATRADGATRADSAIRADSATRADTATAADGVRWSGGAVSLNPAGKWPASSLDIPSNLVTLGDNGRIGANVLPANVVLLDADNRIPLSSLPSGPSGLDAASLGSHTPADAADGDRKIPVLDANGKLKAAALPDGFAVLGQDATFAKLGAGKLDVVGNSAVGGDLTVTGGVAARSQIRSVPVGGTVFGTTGRVIDWNQGNVQTTSASCGAFVFSNMLEGGAYTLVVTGSGSATCSFSQTTPDAPSTFRFQPANGATLANTMTIYTFLRAGGNVFVSWITGF